MKEQLHRRETALAEELLVTAFDLSRVSRYIEFPQDVRALSILHVGGGASTATKELRRKGANACSLDYAYHNRRAMGSLIKAAINRVETANREELQQSIHKLSNFTNPGLTPLALEIGRQYAIVEEKRHSQIATRRFKERQKVTSHTFFRGFKQDKTQPYVAALPGELPFQENTFDFVFSYHYVTTQLMGDYDVFMKIVKEQLRVLKPGRGSDMGGQLQLHPWISDDPAWSAQEKENGQRLLSYLNENDILYFVERNSQTSQDSPRLRIFKP